MRRVYLRPCPDKTPVLGFLSNFYSGSFWIMRIGARATSTGMAIP